MSAITGRLLASRIVRTACGYPDAELYTMSENLLAAGADLIMPVTKTFSTVEEWARCHELVGVPLMATLTASAWTERDFTPEVMEQIGVRIALLPTQVLMAVTGAAQQALRRLAAGESPARVSADAMPHHDFVELIGMAEIERQQHKYLPAATV